MNSDGVLVDGKGDRVDFDENDDAESDDVTYGNAFTKEDAAGNSDAEDKATAHVKASKELLKTMESHEKSPQVRYHLTIQICRLLTTVQLLVVGDQSR